MRRTLVSLFLVACSAPPVRLSAQSTSATISGVVTDASGRLIPGADVEVVNDLTSVRYSAKTNGTGFYALTTLPPATYHVQVGKIGFKTIVKSDLTLNVQGAVALNFKLPLGSATETVTVDAGGIQVNTVDASVSTVVDRTFVENMPLNGRSLQALFTLAPGVSQVPTYVGTANAAGISGEIVVNGQRAEANQFTVDGVSANAGYQPAAFGIGAGVAGSVPSVSAVGTTQSLVSIDALQEFRTSTSTYAAEYGRTPGGAFSLSTRSGTNIFHGSAYEYFRNDVLDANNWFNKFYGYPKGRERQSDFGGTLGGPVRLPHLYDGRGKTFFFVSYEGLRLKAPQATTQVSVPTDATRNNAPAALQSVLRAFPIANYGTASPVNGFAYYLESVSYPSNVDTFSVRGDHALGKRLSVFGRFATSPSSSTTYSGAVQNTLDLKNRSVTLGATWAPTDHQANEFRFSRTGTSGTSSAISTGLGGAIPFDVSSLPGPNGVPFSKTNSQLYAAFTFAANTSLLLSQQPTAQTQYNVTDSHSLTVGRHSFKFGVDWRRTGTLLTPLLPQEQFTFTTIGQVMSNTAASGLVKFQAFQEARPIYLNFSAYGQDEWKVSSHLSASIGVRWDVNPAPTDAFGRGPYTVTQISDLKTTSLAPHGTSLWSTDWKGIAPRVGLAYQVRPGSGYNTVVRSGFGMFYDTGNVDGSYGYAYIGSSSSLSIANAQFPLTSAQMVVPAPSVAAPYRSSVIGFDPHLRLPYTLQYNLAVEQQLGTHQSFTVNYVGSGARKMLTVYQATPSLLGNANFSSSSALLIVNGRGTSSYNSLQTKFQRDLSHGLQALVSYVWSHSIDNASSNFLVYELSRGRSDFDVRHALQAAVTYQIPERRFHPVFARVINGIGIDLRSQIRSAPPVNIIGVQQVDPNTGLYTAFQPNLVDGAPVYLSGNYPGGRLINYKAFANSPVGVNGNVPRNYGRGFGAVQFDLALRRDFHIADRLRAQFRAEAFNILNHPMFGPPQGQLAAGATLFGRPSNTLNGALGGGLNSLYQTGGPRSLQLMLRVSF